MEKWIILDRLREIQIVRDSPQPNLIGLMLNNSYLKMKMKTKTWNGIELDYKQEDLQFGK
jgi:hypothetical protein